MNELRNKHAKWKNDVHQNSGWINELNWFKHIVVDNYAMQKSTKVPFRSFLVVVQKREAWLCHDYLCVFGCYGHD